MSDDNDNRGWDQGWQDLGSVPAEQAERGGGAGPPDGGPAPPPEGPTDHYGTAGAPPVGAGHYPSQVEEMFAEAGHSRQGHSLFAILAAVCGLCGFLLGPFLVGDTPDRYAILVADIAALGLGAVAIWAAVTRYSRLEWAIAGILTGALSLALYVLYVSAPPPPAGST